MSVYKKVVYSLFFVFVITFVAGCSTTEKPGEVEYENGYFITEIHSDIDTVYKATIEALKNGQTFDSSGNPYQIVYNRSYDSSGKRIYGNQEKAKTVLEGASSSDRSDYLTVIMIKASKDYTKLKIKYGRLGNSIRSSALVNIIEGNIIYS